MTNMISRVESAQPLDKFIEPFPPFPCHLELWKEVVHTRHQTVNHSADEWVCGDVHTNGIESVWSLLKRSIIGAYHKVSIKHLDAYLDELEHRFNNRSNDCIFKDTLMKLVQAEKLPYQELIERAA